MILVHIKKPQLGTQIFTEVQLNLIYTLRTYTYSFMYVTSQIMMSKTFPE